MHHTRTLLERAAGEALPAWDSLATSIRLARVAKGGDVFTEGEWRPFVYVVQCGLVKLSYLGEAGDEWIKSFIGEGDFFACPNVLLTRQTTDYAAIALEDCQVEQIDYSVLKQMMDAHLSWQRAVLQLLEWHILRKEQRERELLTLRPEDRYRSFVKTFPSLSRRVQVRDIARYLGVTPEALSRIRSRLKA